MEITSLPEEFVEVQIGAESYPVPAAIDDKSSLADILAFARKQGASDVHITPNNPIFLRKFSHLVSTNSAPLSVQRIEEMLKAEIPKNLFEEFQDTGDLEYVHTVKGSGRFR